MASAERCYRGLVAAVRAAGKVPTISEAAPPVKRSRARRIVRASLVTLSAVIVVTIAGFLVWANVGVMQAERGQLELVSANPAVTITDFGDAVILTPTGQDSELGLVFIPGAKVTADAYLYKLSGIVESAGVTVIVTKPILNLAFFDQRPLTTFAAHATGVTTWFVGGHSLGGVRACQYAEQPDVAGLVLFGSYCANDLSETDVRVLSLSGSEDCLSTPSKISAAKSLLPASATFVEISGANHAGFGDYGVQPGDGTASLSSSQVRELITSALDDFLG